MQPLKSKPVDLNPLSKVPKFSEPDVPEYEAPKLPEKVVNPMDLMPSPKKNPIDLKKPESASFKTPSGFKKPEISLKDQPAIEPYQLKRPVTVKNKKPIDLSNQENDSKLFNAPKF